MRHTVRAIADLVAEYAAIHGKRRTVLEFVLVPPLMLASLFALLFAVPVLEAIR